MRHSLPTDLPSAQINGAASHASRKRGPLLLPYHHLGACPAVMGQREVLLGVSTVECDAFLLCAVVDRQNAVRANLLASKSQSRTSTRMASMSNKGDIGGMAGTGG